MFSYTTRNIHVISLIISIIVFTASNGVYTAVKNLTTKYNMEKRVMIEYAKENNLDATQEEEPNIQQEKRSSIQQQDIKTQEKNTKEQSAKKQPKWEIQIPKINLTAPIAEGVSQEIMNKYVGHFEDTAKLNGNVGLAAHNRGYPVNYFKDLKVLEIGDEIIYQVENQTREYKVEVIKTIKDTNWNYLQETEDNRITLITCVENKPEYRLCIQAVQIP